ASWHPPNELVLVAGEICPQTLHELGIAAITEAAIKHVKRRIVRGQQVLVDRLQRTPLDRRKMLHRDCEDPCALRGAKGSERVHDFAMVVVGFVEEVLEMA